MRRGLITALLLALSACEIPTRLCATQQDCFGGEQCIDGACTESATPDVSNMDAGSDGGNPTENCRLGDDPCGFLICNVSTGACESCQRDSQCDTGELCDTVAGECVCRNDHHLCDGACLPDDSPDSCGTSCTPCPSIENASATCEAGSCGFACNDGFEPCAGCGFDRECIECRTNSDCDAYESARCVEGLCEPCASDDDCSHLDRTICVDGACSECDVGKESPCEGTSCNPATNACTETTIGSLDWCEQCVADSECPPNHRCVAMEFKGNPRRDGYCLQEASTGCRSPDPVRQQATSLSGIVGEFYCFVREDLTTCEAMKDFEKPCDQDSDCGADSVADGLCNSLNGRLRCTVRCTVDDECPGAFCLGTPPSSSYCGYL